ncbi:hypothetical protein E8P77_30545, partial [Soehngenia saccharolytica]
TGKSSALLQNSTARPPLMHNVGTPEPLVQGPFGGAKPPGISRVEVEKDTFSAPLPVPERPVSAGKPSNEFLQKKTKSLLEEYFNIRDTREAKLCLEELKWPSYYPEFVRQAVLLAIEMGERHVESIIILLEYLYAQKPLSERDIKEGIIHIAEECDDITIDIPLAPRHLGEIVGKLSFTGATDLRVLKEAMLKVEDVQIRRTIFDATLRTIRSN